jgi:5-methylcytosine-specific restriction endonuclease McrA
VVDEQVLVLNRNYQPINVTNVRRAFVMLYLDLARAVDKEFRVFDWEQWSRLEASGECWRTVSRSYRVPRVILLQTYDRMPIGQVRFSRTNVFARDNYTCQYCHRSHRTSELNIDHVMPRSRGGTTTWENVVCSCVPCNLKKGRRTPDEAGMHLLRTPTRPRWSALVRHPLGASRHSDWVPYLGPFMPQDDKKAQAE